MVFLFFSLLLAPGVHYKISGGVLYELYLHPDGQTQNGHALALFHILDGKLNHLPGLIKAVIVADGVIMNGMVEKLSLYPAGAYSHNTDAKLFQLHAQCS